MRATSSLRSRPLAVLLTAALSLPAHAAQFLVTRADDPAPDGCQPTDCSLREAIAAAASTPGADRVQLAAGQYNLTQDRIDVFGNVEVAGAGSDQTRIVGHGVPRLLQTTPQAALSVRGVELLNTGAWAVGTQGAGSVHLVDVVIPDGGDALWTQGSTGHAFDMVIENSRLGLDAVVACHQASGLCRAVDSALRGGIAAYSDAVAVQVLRSVIGPEPGETGLAGIVIDGRAPLLVEDSVVRHVLWPLQLSAEAGSAATAVNIRRTRFHKNHGPMGGNRPGTVYLDEVEVYGHAPIAALQGPAVLLAEAGPMWIIRRSLVHGNRGNGIEGGAILVLAGARVAIANSTFHDNTFQAGSNGYGHTIAVYNASQTPAALQVHHSTFHRGPELGPTAQGSLLTVRGPATQVILSNTVLRGTCAFGGGGSIAGALGNIESPGGVCVPAADNMHVPEMQLRMGALADHGGFSWSFQPDPGSVLLDNAHPALCAAVGLDQRRYLRPAGGVDCDVGAIEAGAVSDLIFADGVEGD